MYSQSQPKVPLPVGQQAEGGASAPSYQSLLLKHLCKESDSANHTPRSSASGQHQMIVKNTFIEVVEDDEDDEDGPRLSMTRFYSDSGLSHSSSHRSKQSSLKEKKLEKASRSRDLSATRSSGASGASDSEGSTSMLDLENGSASWPDASGGEAAAQAAQVWSVGSELHQSGQCKPCVYFNNEAGCLKGSKCKFCHLCRKRKGRQRPCKSTRNQCKQVAALLDTVFLDDSKRHEAATKQLASQSNYMRQILKGRQGVDPVSAATVASGSGGQPSVTRLSL